MKRLLTFVLTFILLNCFSQVPTMNPIAGASVACSSPSSSLSFTASASNGPTSYSWSVASPTPGVIITNSASSVASVSFPYSNGTYTLYCLAINGFGSSATTSFVVTVFETPSVSFSGASTFCQGSSTNLSASSTILAASPTISYNWSPGIGLNTTVGSNVIANPSIPITYTVTAVKGICSNSSQITISPLNSPTITTLVTYSVICFGDTTTLTAFGANTYTWTNGVVNGVFFSPNATNVYYVSGTGANGCTSTKSVTVTVNPLPTFTASSSASLICNGSTAIITIVGTAVSYSYNSVPTATLFAISPTTTTSYFINAINAFGCKKSTSYVQNVSPCTGLENYNNSSNIYFNVYPNPSNGFFNIKSNSKESIKIINELGQIIQTIEVNPDAELSVSGLKPGMYFILSNSRRVKILITN